MKRLFTSFLLLVCGVMIANAQQDTSRLWTLRQCIDYAVANNLTVRRAAYTSESANVDLREAQFNRVPSVNGSAAYGTSWGRGLDPVSNSYVTQQINSSNLGANASLPIINGLRITNTIKQRDKTFNASVQDLQKAKNDLTINVATLFINVVFNKELVENARYQLSSTQQQLDRTKKQVAAGALSRSEELNLEAQVATNEVNLVQQENALALSLLQLKQALQIPDSEPFDVEIPAIEPEDIVLQQTRDEIYGIARQIMPEIKSAELKIQSSEYAWRAAKGNLYPRLNLVGQVNTNYSSIAQKYTIQGTTWVPAAYTDKDVTSTPVWYQAPNRVVEPNYNASKQFKDNIYRVLSLQLTIPIFNNYTAHSNVQRARIQNEQAKINAKETDNTLRQNVETAYNNALAASKSYAASQRQVSAREEAFRMLQQRYDAGAANYVEYQVSQNDLFRAKSDLLRAKYDFIFRSKVLDLYQGKPVY